MKKKVLLSLVGSVLAFAGLADVGLPDGYTRLTSIRSTGTQWINTRIVPDETTTLAFHFGVEQTPTEAITYFGQVWAPSSWLLCFQSPNMNFYGPSGTFLHTVWTAGTDVWVRIEDDGKLYQTLNFVDEAPVAISRASTSTEPLRLLSADKLGRAVCRVFEFSLAKGDGTRIHLVPCLTPDGQAGLYDIANEHASASEGFYGNAGTGAFLYDTEETLVKPLKFLQSTNAQFIKTDIVPDAQTKIAIHLSNINPSHSQHEVYFAQKWAGSSWLFSTLSSGPVDYFGAGTQFATRNDWLNHDVYVWFENETVFSAIDSAVKPTTGTAVSFASQANLPLYVFGTKEGGGGPYYSRCRIHDLTITTSDGVMHDLQPTLVWNGVLGLLDAATGKFFGECAGLSQRFFYSEDGSTLNLSSGTVTEQDIAGMTNVRKLTSGTLNATAITSYPGDLAIDEGVFTLQDGRMQAVVIQGALDLKANTTLRLDASASGNDSFTANAVHVEAPVRIELPDMSGQNLQGRTFTFIQGGLTTQDAMKFVVSCVSHRLIASVENGALVVREMTLPEGYSAREYIVARHLNGTKQWIDTGVVPDVTTAFAIHFYVDQKYDALQVFFGQKWAAYSWLFAETNGKWVGFWDDNLHVRETPYAAKSDVRIWIDEEDRLRESVNNGTASVFSADRRSDNPALPLRLFSVDNFNGASYRLYEVWLAKGDGTKRHLVPCTNPAGEVGLYDLANAYANPADGFFGNAGSGVLEDNLTGVCLGYVTSSNTQYVNTGLVPTAQSKAEFHLSNINPTHTQHEVFCAQKWTGNAWLFTVLAGGAVEYFGAGTPFADRADWVGHQVHVWFENGQAYSAVDSLEKPSVGTAIDQTPLANRPLYLLGVPAIEKAGAYYSKCNLHRFKLTQADGTCHEFVPFCLWTGEVGLFDRTTGTFHPSETGKPLGWGGIVYTVAGTVATVQRGELLPIDVVGWTEIEKVTVDPMSAGSVTAYPGALTLREGSLELTNGVAQAVSVAGKLTLTGGTSISFDLDAHGVCDTLAAGSVDLSGATGENPVTINLTVLEGVTAARTYDLITGGVTAADRAKFVVNGLDALDHAWLTVSHGKLQIVCNAPTCILVR